MFIPKDIVLISKDRVSSAECVWRGQIAQVKRAWILIPAPPLIDSATLDYLVNLCLRFVICNMGKEILRRLETI